MSSLPLVSGAGKKKARQKKRRQEKYGHKQLYSLSFKGKIVGGLASIGTYAGQDGVFEGTLCRPSEKAKEGKVTYNDGYTVLGNFVDMSGISAHGAKRFQGTFRDWRKPEKGVMTMRGGSFEGTYNANGNFSCGRMRSGADGWTFEGMFNVK